MVFILLFLAPFWVGAAAEYAVCRFLQRRLWRLVPPLVFLLLAAGSAYIRYQGWSESVKAPVETLMIFPGIPAAGLLLGAWLGWRSWRWFWAPRIVWERRHHGKRR